MGIVTSIFTSVASSCACSCCCAAVKSASKATRAMYALLLLLTTAISAILLSGALTPLLKKIPIYGASWADGIPDSYQGRLAVIRMAFGVFLFHVIMSGILVNVKNSKDPRSKMQNDLWIFKIVALLGLCVLGFFVPAGFLTAFTYICQIGAGIFILVQLLLLVTLAHDMAEKFIESYNGGAEKSSCFVLAAGSLVMYAATFAIAIFLFISMSSSESKCTANFFVVILVLIASILLSMASINPQVQVHLPSSGIFQASVVALYSMYLVGSAVLSAPEGSCDALSKYSSSSKDAGAKIIGLLVTFVCVMYTTVRMGSKTSSEMHTSLVETTEIDDEEKAETEKSALESEDDKTKEKKEDDEVQAVQYNYAQFHLVFALAAMYIAMTLNEWAVPHLKDNIDEELDFSKSKVSVWIKTVSAVVSLLLYGWTLYAPIVFPNRDFS